MKFRNPNWIASLTLLLALSAGFLPVWGVSAQGAAGSPRFAVSLPLVFSGGEAGIPPAVAPTATLTVASTPVASTPVSPTAVAPTPVIDQEVILTKGPVLIFTGKSTEMKIFWQWTANEKFRVDWGADANYRLGSAAVSAYDAGNHLYAYTITGLTPGKKYFYRVVSGSRYSSGAFYTAPAATASSLKFVSYGDTRSNPKVHDAVAGQVNALYRSDPAYQTLNAMVGDLVTRGDTDSYWSKEFFDPSLSNLRTELANMAMIPVMGNHEGSGVLFNRYFPMPYVAPRYWSFDYGPAHFTYIDQYHSYEAGSAQYNWIRDDLARTTQKWKFVVLHEPGWSAAGGHSNNTTVQKVLEPLFEKYGVSIVFAGHNHYYARAVVNGIQHLTIGTGGAPLADPRSGQPNVVKTYKGAGYSRFEINDGTLTGTFVDASGKTRDTFTIQK